MKQLKIVGILIAAMGLVALALALAPSAYGQTRERANRSLMMLAGRGAQIGVRIADGPADGVVVEEVQPTVPPRRPA